VVEVLALSKQDLLQRVSKDIRELIEQKVQMKLEWIKNRLIEICIGVENVALWDNLQQDFIDKVSDCTKKYPASNFGAFVKIVSQTASIKPDLESAVKNTVHIMDSPELKQAGVSNNEIK
jgi:hypothetical protein